MHRQTVCFSAHIHILVSQYYSLRVSRLRPVSICLCSGAMKSMNKQISLVENITPNGWANTRGQHPIPRMKRRLMALIPSSEAELQGKIYLNIWGKLTQSFSTSSDRFQMSHSHWKWVLSHRKALFFRALVDCGAKPSETLSQMSSLQRHHLQTILQSGGVFLMSLNCRL